MDLLLRGPRGQARALAHPGQRRRAGADDTDGQWIFGNRVSRRNRSVVPTHQRQLVDCVRSSAFATAGPTVVYVACEPGSKPTLHALDTISGRDRLLGRLEKFEPDMPHVNLAVSPDGKTILYRGVTRKGGDLMMIEDFR
jgi:hypothetical protein